MLLNIINHFRDPHSAFDIPSQYAFMTIGPVSPLPFAGTPLFLTAFNTTEEFLRKIDYRGNNYPTSLCEKFLTKGGSIL